MRTRMMFAVAAMMTVGIGLTSMVGTTWAQKPPALPAPALPPTDAGTMDTGVPGMHEHQHGMQGSGMRERRMEMMRELDLSKEQREKMADLREKQERAAIRMRADQQTARLDLRRLMRAEKADRPAIDRQIDKMAQLRAEMEKARVGMMLDMRGLLTPEQQERMRERMGR